MMKLTCLLDLVQNFESARERKQGEKEYQERQSEFDQLEIHCFYSTIELSVLGHYLSPSLSSLQNCINFVDETTMLSKSSCRILTWQLQYLSPLPEEYFWHIKTCY